MSERNPKRFENGSNAQSRSPEEQQRLIEESDRERYEATMAADETAYNEAMAAREASAHEDEVNEYAETEGRVMEDVETRRMYMLAQQIAEGRNNGVEPEIIADKEEALQELLLNYTNKAYSDRDLRVRNAEINATSTPKGKEREEAERREAEQELAPKIKAAEFILNSTDSAWVSEKLATSGAKEAGKPDDLESLDESSAPEVKEARSPEEFSETDSPEQMIADIADLISKETDPVKKAEAQEKLREIMTQIEGALEGKDKKDDLGDLDDLSAPELKDGEKSDLDDLDAAEAPKVGDEADLEDLDDKEAPKVADPADKKDVDGEEHDLEDLDKLSAPEVGEAPAETEDTRRWYKRAWDRAGLIFVLGMNKAGERMHLPEKRSTRVATAIGAVTLLAVGGALAWKYGFHHGGSGNGGNADPSTVPTPKPKVTPEVPVVPTPKGPELPSADNYAHPWNWMKAAMDNGSVTPPKGMGPEQALHYFGEKAADAGHKVEWYNLPNGLEAVRIDGSDDTKVVGDILGQFAK
jgi:hypothetical protein